MKVITWETLYYEDHGATLKHKCGKRIVTLSLLSFSLIFWAFSFYGLSLFFGPSLFMDFFYIPHLGQCSRKWWSSHFYLFTTQWLQLVTKTKYDSIWMPPAVYRDMQWIKSDMYENYEGGLATNTMSTTWSCKEQYDNDGACHNNRTVESCMAIYLGMAMEMP